MSTKKGNKGEEAACRYLQRHGYQVLDRNRRLARGELDIVALKGDILVFVEVKAHKQRETSLLAMHEDKCKRIISAALAWQALHKAYADYQCRFDLIIVTPRKPAILPHMIEHMPDVIRV